MEEQWKDVIGHEGQYRISDQGRFEVLRLLKTKGSWQYPGIRSGDLRLSLIRDGRNRRVHISVLVLETFVGPKPEGLECCHANDDRKDNRLSNLRWDTHRANKLDAFANGIVPVHGESVGCSVLNAEKVIEARKLYADGWSYESLAKRYGVVPTTVRCAVLKLTWSHI